ncbi:hypothetical protein bsdtw1_02630 [Clostridium fungisolvens]|uniref:Glycoside hydrolase family 3 N-terminal domain-containing protein n=1 Tax=Clostridium fungisolvens TaxID=1604897 RepID=A0A6V8SH81_9CLOT|nr:hypothetical protein bsdtw1_02630 [Clostridium fungisolvens]
MSAKVIQGCYDNKLVAMVKHFALNEQETARNVDGLYTWANEQSIREIYLRPFEIAVKTSDNRAIMTSFNRIGATWTGSSFALLTDLLRNEWGYRGVCESDAYVPMKGGDSTYYMNMNAGIRAGNDLWLQGIGTQGPSVDTNKAYTVSLMRERAHNILYAVSNTNHLKADTSLPLWEILLIVGSVVIYVACLFSLYRCFLHKRKEKVANLQ